MLLDVQASKEMAVEAAFAPKAKGRTGAARRPFSVYGVQYHRRSARQFFRLGLVAGDIAVIALCFAVASGVRLPGGLGEYLKLMTIVLPIYAAVALNGGAFSLEAIRNNRFGIKRAFGAYFLSMAIVALMLFFLKPESLSLRAILGLGSALALVALPAARAAIVRNATRIIGDVPFVELVIQDDVAIDLGPDTPVIVARDYGLKADVSDPRYVLRLGEHVRDVDRVIVACRPERQAEWAQMLKALDVNAEICLPELHSLGAVAMNRVGGHPTLVISAGPLILRDRIVKRGFDLAFVCALLPFLLIPMLAVALAIRLETPGPIFFRQLRIGLGNRPFHILKFRSMRVETGDAAGNRSASRDDDRITRVGRFIRRTSIDELPQLFNVLLGDMSIVGPRPHAMGSRAEDQLFWDIDNRYWHRHAVKPGLTGLAQVRGYRGATAMRADLSNRLQADLEYRSRWSLLRDVSIVFATLKVLVHRNAF